MDHNRRNFHSIDSSYWRRYHWKTMPNNWIYRHNCNDHGTPTDFPWKSNHRRIVGALCVQHRLHHRSYYCVLYSGYICRCYIWKWLAREYWAGTMFSSIVYCAVDPRNNRRWSVRSTGNIWWCSSVSFLVDPNDSQLLPILQHYPIEREREKEKNVEKLENCILFCRLTNPRIWENQNMWHFYLLSENWSTFQHSTVWTSRLQNDIVFVFVIVEKMMIIRRMAKSRLKLWSIQPQNS